jgi:hypothetical protein
LVVDSTGPAAATGALVSFVANRIRTAINSKRCNPVQTDTRLTSDQSQGGAARYRQLAPKINTLGAQLQN